jgi:hypothetical protein
MPKFTSENAREMNLRSQEAKQNKPQDRLELAIEMGHETYETAPKSVQLMIDNAIKGNTTMIKEMLRSVSGANQKITRVKKDADCPHCKSIPAARVIGEALKDNPEGIAALLDFLGELDE